MEKKIQKEEQEKNEKCIIENIEKRYSMIGKIERQMLNSILKRPWKSILIEKVLVESNSLENNRELITDLEEVKEITEKHFQKQFCSRKHKFEELKED